MNLILILQKGDRWLGNDHWARLYLGAVYNASSTLLVRCWLFIVSAFNRWSEVSVRFDFIELLVQLLRLLESHAPICNMLVNDGQLLVLGQLHLAHLFSERLLLVLKPGRVISEGRLTDCRLYKQHFRWDISARARWHLLLLWDTLSEVLTNFRLEYIVLLGNLWDFSRVILLLCREWWHCLVHMHRVGGWGRILKSGRVIKWIPYRISLNQIIAFGLRSEDCLWLAV